MKLTEKNGKVSTTKKVTPTKAPSAPKFTAEELKQSSQFTRVEKDFLVALVKEPVTVDEARRVLDKKMKEVVK